ncbi:MAG: multidrug efflux MFS transporter [Lentisphaerae bacterium]|nr:multidrug efflux MFS transporter [Lentisphaerota bacterium]MBR2873439.1 MFS transporter [Lentisphaeria bacterium]
MSDSGTTVEIQLEKNNSFWLRNVILVTIAQFFGQLAFCSAMTFMPFWFKDVAMIKDQGELSMYVALYNVAGNLSFCIFAPIWGILGDRYGRKMMLLRATFGGAILTPLMAFIADPALMIWHRLALGALVGTVTAAQTLIVTTTPEKHLTISLGAASAGMFAGIMGGQFLGGELVNRLGFFQTFMWCGVLLGISTLLILFTKENFHPVVRKKKLRNTAFKFRLPRFGNAGLLLLLFVFMGFSRDIDGPFLPQLVMEVVKESKDALRWTGWINGMCALAGMLSGLILGYAASKLPLLKVLACVIAIAGSMRLLLAFSPTPEIVMIERFVQVLAGGGMEPLFQAWLAGVTRPHNHSKMLGWSATARSTGWMTGSFAGGGIAVALGGVHGLFLIAGCFYFLMIPAMLYVARRVPPPGVGRKNR